MAYEIHVYSLIEPSHTKKKVLSLHFCLILTTPIIPWVNHIAHHNNIAPVRGLIGHYSFKAQRVSMPCMGPNDSECPVRGVEVALIWTNPQVSIPNHRMPHNYDH